MATKKLTKKPVKQTIERRILDRVTKHLLKQRQRAFDQKKQRCCYLGPDGKRCAAGCLISPKYYRPSLEGIAINKTIDDEKVEEVYSAIEQSLRHKLTVEARELIAYLQHVHDKHHVEDWPNELREITKHCSEELKEKLKA